MCYFQRYQALTLVCLQHVRLSVTIMVSRDVKILHLKNSVLSGGILGDFKDTITYGGPKGEQNLLSKICFASKIFLNFKLYVFE